MKLSVFLEDELSISPGSVKLSIKSQLEKYREKYEALIKKKDIIMEAYRVMPAGYVIVWLKIPSQSLNKFYYDVLLQLEPGDGAKSFEECDVKFFSNSPSFVYGGYAYIFYHLDADPKVPGKGMMIDQFRQKIPRDNLLIPKATSKLGKEAVTEEPVVRNVLGIPMPDFSIYCAIFHLLDNVSFQSVIKTRKYRTMTQLVSSVNSFDHIMAERKRQENREKREADSKKQQESKAVKEVLKQHTAGIGTKTATQVKHAMRPKSTANARTNRGKTKGVNKIG